MGVRTLSEVPGGLDPGRPDGGSDMVVIGVLVSVATLLSAVFATQGRLRWTEYEVSTRAGVPDTW